MIHLKDYLIVEKKIITNLKTFFYMTKAIISKICHQMLKILLTTIIAEKGLVEKRKFYLFNGQIISSKKDNSENEIIKFEQLNIDMGNLSTSTIKKPKLQETSTVTILKCFLNQNPDADICNSNAKKEMIPLLNRRLALPFYIPVVAMICSLLLINTKKNSLNKISIFIYSFILLIFTEMTVRYTGINNFVRALFLIMPVILFILLYSLLRLKFSKESISKWIMLF